MEDVAQLVLEDIVVVVAQLVLEDIVTLSLTTTSRAMHM